MTVPLRCHYNQRTFLFVLLRHKILLIGLLLCNVSRNKFEDFEKKYSLLK